MLMSIQVSSNAISRPSGFAANVILVIDNYDSFTFNLVQLIRGVAPDTQLLIRRNDEITPAQVAALAPAGIVISPGPGRPTDAVASVQIARRFAETVPLLGVCLGHQCIAHAFGGRIVPSRTLVHGKTRDIHHDGASIFAGVASPFVAARYHSLAVERQTLPAQFVVSGWTADEEVMAFRHRCLPVFGIQFHPESFLTLHGQEVLSNFLRRCYAPPLVCSSIA